MSRTSLKQAVTELTDFERRLINHLQGGFPLATDPYSILAEQLHSTPRNILSAIESLLERGVLTRFGPLLNIEKTGGAFSLCALQVPEARFEEVSNLVNSYSQVAHNYQREHDWNMWFVLATETETELLNVYDEIVRRSDCPGLNLPKQEEYYVGLRLQA